MFSGRVFRGSLWLGFSRVVAQLISFARVVVLSRLLAPDDFGTFAIALSLLSVLAVLSQTGFNQAIVQSNQSVDRFAHVVWTFHLMRGITICLALLLVGPSAAAWFDVPQAAPLIQAIGVCALVRAFVSMGHVYQQKDVQFRAQSIQNTVGIAVDAAVTIYLATTIGGPWALTIGLVTGELAKTIASYALHSYRPRLAFDRRVTQELMPYSRWIYVSSLILLANSAGPALIVGKLLGAAPLGIYQMSARLAGMASTELSVLLSQVAFPVYSGIRDSREQVHHVYSRSVAVVSVVALPISLVLLLRGPEVVEVLLGAKWEAVAGPLAVLSVEGIFRLLASTAVPVFRGMGVPSYETTCNALRTVVFLIVAVPLTMRCGVTGTAIALAISSMTWFVVSAHLLHRSTGISWVVVLRKLVPILAATAGMTIVLFATRNLLGGGVAGLVAATVVSALVYVSIAWHLGVKKLLV